MDFAGSPPYLINQLYSTFFLLNFQQLRVFEVKHEVSIQIAELHSLDVSVNFAFLALPESDHL